MAPPPPVSPSSSRWPLVVAGGVLVLVIVGVVLSLQKRADAAKGPTTVVASASARPRSVVPVALLPRASVAGTVRDGAGKPLAQASVCASLSSTVPDAVATSAQRRTPRCVTTGSDGAYALTEVFSRTRLVVSGSAEGFAPAVFRSPVGDPFLTLAEGEQRAGVDLVLVPGVALKGRVSDVTGGSVSGALVSAGSDEEPVFSSSDAKGEFTLWVAPGTARVRASAQGYAPGAASGPAPEHFFSIQLVPGATLVGRVVLAGTETPVAGARVEAIQLEGTMRRSVSVRSDDDGRFRIEGLEPGRFRIEATSDGREGYSRSSVTLAMGETSSEVVVEMDPAYTVRGRVVDDAGKPCTEGDVRLTDHAQDEFAQSDIDGDGWAEMRSVIPGSYAVEVNCKGAISRSDFPLVVVVDRDAPEQRWTVDRGARLVVTVVDSHGKLVPRASVGAQLLNAAEFRYASTDRPEADGTYLVGGLLAGEHEVDVRGDDGSRVEQKVTVSAHGEERLRVELKAVGVLDGVVEDEDHHPIVSVSLWVHGPTGVAGEEPTRRFTRSLDDGTFHVAGLLPGEYEVTAGDRLSRSRRADSPKPIDDPIPSVKATVTASSKTKVKLTLPRREGVIEGKVVTREGNPVTDAFLEFFRVRDRSVSSASSGRPQVMTDMDGHFRIDGLDPGDYRLRAARRGGGEATIEGVKPGRRDVVMTLSEGGVIAGHLDSPRGAVERFDVKVKRKEKPFQREEMFFHAGGAFALHDLPAGTYEVEAETPLGVASTEVTLAEGEKRTDLRLTLSMRGAIDGRVVSLDTGASLAGVNVTVSGESSSDLWKNRTSRDMVTGPDGRFHLDGVLAGSWTITFGATPQATVKFETQDVPVTVNESATTDLGSVRIVPRRVDDGSPRGQLGVSVAWDTKSPSPGGLAVSGVFDPAEAAGLKEGDVIVSVDGTDVRGVNGYLFEPLTTVPPGRSVSFGLARGQAVTVVARGDE